MTIVRNPPHYYPSIHPPAHQSTANAGSRNGRGADVSLSGCTRSFDGLAACGANDTVLVNSHVGYRGGAVTVGGDGPSYVELHRCTVDNSSAGFSSEEESQGAGGAISVGEGDTFRLVDSTLTNNHCVEKVGAKFYLWPVEHYITLVHWCCYER